MSKPFCKSYHVPLVRPGHQLPHGPSQGYAPDILAMLYGVPANAPGEPGWVDLIELGGGHNPVQINAWCDKRGYAHPIIQTVSIDGATNDYTGDPQGADGEVALDIAVRIGVAHRAWPGKPAKIRVLYAPNSDAGFLHAVQALKNNCGISWGGPESSWSQSSMSAFSAAVQERTVNGNIKACCASGDSGSSDGTSGASVDFPGSTVYGVCCGGTSIVTGTMNGQLTITNESVWNHDNGAGGGGVSKVFKRPSYQDGFVTDAGRCVPDLSANADPSSGWDTPFGTIGGTSAVAPFVASCFDVLDAIQTNGGKAKIGFPHPTMYAHEKDAFRDITAGNNSLGAPGFAAGTGYDKASGLGVGLWDKLAIAYGGTQPTPTPVPTPTPIPTPIPTPVPAPVPPPVQHGPSYSDVKTVTDSTFKSVEARSPQGVRPYLTFTNLQLDLNLARLFAPNLSQEQPMNEYLSRSCTVNDVAAAHGINPDVVLKALGLGISWQQILKLLAQGGLTLLEQVIAQVIASGGASGTPGLGGVLGGLLGGLSGPHVKYRDAVNANPWQAVASAYDAWLADQGTLAAAQATIAGAQSKVTDDVNAFQNAYSLALAASGGLVPMPNLPH